MSKLLKWLMSFALPMNIIGGDGGGGPTNEALSTDSFADMLDAPDDNGQADPSDPQNAPDDQANPDDTDPQTDPDADPAPDPDADPDGQPETDPAADVIELEIDGEKVALTKDEVKNGYLRQQDYTQKTQALAREKQEQAQFVQQQMESVTQFSREIGQLHQIDTALAQYQAVDWQALRAEDPQSYSIHLAEFNDLRARRSDAVNQIGQKQQQLTAKQAETFATQTREAAEHMAKVVPGFGKEHLDQMKEFGLKHGFTAEELGKIADKRMLEVLYKASAFDKTQAETKKAVKKVAQLPTRAAKAAPAAKPAKDQHIEKVSRRLSQTGSVKDFAALLDMTSKG